MGLQKKTKSSSDGSSFMTVGGHVVGRIRSTAASSSWYGTFMGEQGEPTATQSQAGTSNSALAAVPAPHQAGPAPGRIELPPLSVVPVESGTNAHEAVSQ